MAIVVLSAKDAPITPSRRSIASTSCERSSVCMVVWLLAREMAPFRAAQAAFFV
jgi:hypothetical protein